MRNWKKFGEMKKKMKYNSYDGIYEWIRVGIYRCTICNRDIRASSRLKHIGKHVSNGELIPYTRVRYTDGELARIGEVLYRRGTLDQLLADLHKGEEK